jgi:hypothetical protein
MSPRPCSAAKSTGKKSKTAAASALSQRAPKPKTKKK